MGNDMCDDDTQFESLFAPEELSPVELAAAYVRYLGTSDDDLGWSNNWVLDLCLNGRWPDVWRVLQAIQELHRPPPPVDKPETSLDVVRGHIEQYVALAAQVYEKLRQDYMISMKKFMDAHPGTISGMELELGAVNPKLAWDRLQYDHKNRVAQLSPDIAQTKYLVGRADTDLDGRALIVGLAPGSYWISSLGMDAASGDRHLRWDVPTSIQASQTTRVNLTNFNAIDINAALR
jgi:hypothetical protein